MSSSEAVSFARTLLQNSLFLHIKEEFETHIEVEEVHAMPMSVVERKKVLGEVCNALANHALNVLRSKDNITVMIVALDKSTPAHYTGTPGATDYSSSGGIEFPVAPTVDIQKADFIKEKLHAPIQGMGTVPQQRVGDADDMMDFLLDDSNF